MRIKVCSLILFFFGCYNNFLADPLLIQVKVVDNCIEAKILNNKIKYLIKIAKYEYKYPNIIVQIPNI